MCVMKTQVCLPRKSRVLKPIPLSLLSMLLKIIWDSFIVSSCYYICHGHIEKIGNIFKKEKTECLLTLLFHDFYPV